MRFHFLSNPGTFWTHWRRRERSWSGAASGRRSLKAWPPGCCRPWSCPFERTARHLRRWKQEGYFCLNEPGAQLYSPRSLQQDCSYIMSQYQIQHSVQISQISEITNIQWISDWAAVSSPIICRKNSLKLTWIEMPYLGILHRGTCCTPTSVFH